MQQCLTMWHLDYIYIFLQNMEVCHFDIPSQIVGNFKDCNLFQLLPTVMLFISSSPTLVVVVFIVS